MNNRIVLNNEEYFYMTNIKDNDKIRKSFNELAKQTYGLSFERWHQLGYWNNKYIPHVLLKDGCVVSSISVNIIDMKHGDRIHRCIQLGTVMTDDKYRKKGLSKYIINQIIDEWKDKCEHIYLYGNDDVVNFYPKFGFVKYDEYQYSMKYKDLLKLEVRDNLKNTDFIKLDMSCKKNRQLLFELYMQGNMFSKYYMCDNFDLFMFYCTQFLDNNIYYSKKYNVSVICEFDVDDLICYEIIGQTDYNMLDILYNFITCNNKNSVSNIVFGFTPAKICDIMNFSKINQEDTTNFIFNNKDNFIEEEKLMFPLLSRA